ncbi:hypothetical protein ACFU9X_38750 [Streptomyces atratus]|uniref:hypothetical protein n=1 Tax=Streptomyces atratus TaxID=1893 RepID=UPI0036C691EC
MDPTTARHIRSATALPADALAILNQASSAGDTRAARVPASEHSAIDHAVASALLLRVDELNRSRMVSSAVPAYTTRAGLPPYTPVARILEGGENEVFEGFFN